MCNKYLTIYITSILGFIFYFYISYIFVVMQVTVEMKKAMTTTLKKLKHSHF